MEKQRLRAKRVTLKTLNSHAHTHRSRVCELCDPPYKGHTLTRMGGNHGK